MDVEAGFSPIPEAGSEDVWDDSVLVAAYEEAIERYMVSSFAVTCTHLCV